MLWSFIAVCLSAWLSVDASYRGPTWQRWVFKPLTLLLLLLLAWQAPMFDAISYLVLAGLCASLLGDALTLLPRQRLMYAIGAFFLSHLLYTIYFASQMTLSFFWPLHWCCWFWVRCYWRLSGRAWKSTVGLSARLSA